MLVDYTKVSHIYIVCGKTDMRRGIDGLASIIMEQYELDIYSDALFLFCGGSLNKLKHYIGRVMVSCFSTKDLKMASFAGQENK